MKWGIFTATLLGGMLIGSIPAMIIYKEREMLITSFKLIISFALAVLAFVAVAGAYSELHWIVDLFIAGSVFWASMVIMENVK